MTEKLFYLDAYKKDFTARVLSCEQSKDGWTVTLDRTAFYPEGGGQPSDVGKLGGANVRYVYEKDGVIFHETDAPIESGEATAGEIDFPHRFSLMQNHTGEHILSGLLYKRHGLRNVGFHMGQDAITVDVDGAISAADIAALEREANAAVYANAAVSATWPGADELAALEYRSKKALTGDIRIVNVPGYDTCACCGLHCKATGEVGLIKILAAQNYKGGTRIFLLCGERAFADYSAKNESVYKISNLLSAKPHEVAEAAEKILNEKDALKLKVSSAMKEIFRLRASLMEECTTAVLYEDGLSPYDLRLFALQVCERAEVAAVFSQNSAGAFHYAVASKTADAREISAKLNAALNGRGGGKKELAQGSVNASRGEIEKVMETGVVADGHG